MKNFLCTTGIKIKDATKDHQRGYKKYGITKYHRLSFRLLPEQLKLNL
jgi:hypothetical protein